MSQTLKIPKTSSKYPTSIQTITPLPAPSSDTEDPTLPPPTIASKLCTPWSQTNNNNIRVPICPMDPIEGGVKAYRNPIQNHGGRFPTPRWECFHLLMLMWNNDCENRCRIRCCGEKAVRSGLKVFKSSLYNLYCFQTRQCLQSFGFECCHHSLTFFPKLFLSKFCRVINPLFY